MKSPRIRHQFHTDADLSRRLDQLAALPGQNKSAVLEAAARAWVERRDAQAFETAFANRLNRLGRQLDRIERDQKIVLESLILYVRMTLQRDAHLPDPDADSRAKGRERFEAFIAQIGRKLAQGTPTFSNDEETAS
ncbi:ribbon-helix-helix protein, CopG family [Asticcacaulis sp. BYS171W]|uniref:Ribbon-helix-helix protein, CopG family n=1 Tax=Asticcacaulis aquaticus TaxID=2984212 RepID=A0ABT5HQ12_9CAUL|nr:ribbon-helix-helix protein, CopG family [Asticcacaulis aquaticus]MDC7682141.1 ribbon-helix-helix protein, CopG family [Asticcacaulis aquaticus]